MLLPLLPGTLPPGFCPSDEQARLNEYMAVSSAVLTGGMAFYNFGPDKPSVPNQAYPWFRTTDGRWYYFSGVWKAPVNYSAFDVRWFSGTLTDLLTYDGGDNGTPSPTSGPMWTEVTEFRGRSPMAPGDIPTANPAKTLSVGENYGEGAHVQTVAELVAHTHPPATNFSNFAGFVSPGQPSTFEITGGTEVEKMGLTGETGRGDAMPIIHPCRGLYAIKWTGRAFWIVP